jgi:hypothetical protein
MIVVVTGPPCGGKSTYIKDNARSGDVIIDMDKIALALTTDDTPSHSYSQEVRWIAMQARKAAVKEALYQFASRRGPTAWIIHTDPTSDERSQYRLRNAQIVEINPGKEVCLERVKSRPQDSQPRTVKGISDYFQKR